VDYALVYSTLKGSLCGCGKMLVVTMHWINWLVLALLADELP